ncbi:hypothetical protein H5410_052119 [Solanum commersonii]|uniref:Integrase core domain containing protein n=1 Tax=Solanum commersonii TaxID=4109 RepID=A0A9J5X2G7_SOLCO|nr:hypothetical protein H5410_052119 [Solanum commersonii]
MAPSSTRSTPQLGATVVPLARVQKLEAKMAILLHHIQPWMQKSIVEFEARMERMIEGMMDWKVQLASLLTDVDAILATPTIEPQAALTALTDDTVLDVLFNRTAEEGLDLTHAKGPENKIKTCTISIKLRPITPMPPGYSDFSRFGQICPFDDFSLKNDVNRSIIGQITSFGINVGYLDFTRLHPTTCKHNPTF